jgi:hypothetical protein
MTTNVLPDRVIRTVFFSLLAAIAVFVDMLLLTNLHPLGNSRRTSSVSTECPYPVSAGIVPIRQVVSVIIYCSLYH